jgi:hypothetical protein
LVFLYEARISMRSQLTVPANNQEEESVMSNFITVGKRLIPIRDIVLVEPYEARGDAPITSEKTFRGRVVLLDRDSALIEETPEAFGENHGLRLIEKDRSAINTAVARFRVEIFEPSQGFTPTKPYRTRLKWMQGEDEHSKLLVTEPEAVLAIVMGETEVPAADEKLPPARSANSSRPRRARNVPRSRAAPQQV